jgi:hypothetical protein
MLEFTEQVSDQFRSAEEVARFAFGRQNVLRKSCFGESKSYSPSEKRSASCGVDLSPFAKVGDLGNSGVVFPFEPRLPLPVRVPPEVFPPPPLARSYSSGRLAFCCSRAWVVVVRQTKVSKTETASTFILNANAEDLYSIDQRDRTCFVEHSIIESRATAVLCPCSSPRL